MRLPKFRCKNKIGNWCFFTVLHNGNVNEENFDLETLSQFTGLLDKQGVEIYEGDILAGCNGSINGTGWNWGNYSISFKDGKFDVPLWGTFEHYDSTHWFEVIGNIYQNPELLEQTKCGS